MTVKALEKTIQSKIPSSFRDPSGFLFKEHDTLYRQINSVYQIHYDLLMESGLYDSLTKKNMLIKHEEIRGIVSGNVLSVYKVIKPEFIPFISYPYEWCFTQLKDAALLTLDIQIEAMSHGMSLKDSSSFNVQFYQGRPIFIDSLSFEKYEEGKPWVAYKQFCQHFLAPLVLMANKDIRLSHLLKDFIDGIPLDLASELLPFSSKFNVGIATHIHLHARTQKQFADKGQSQREVKVSKNGLLGIIDSFKSTINKLQWKAQGTEWAEYYDETNYSEKGFNSKKEIIERYLKSTNPKIVWDMGANRGEFSQLAAKRGAKTISFDVDPAAVEKNYCWVVQEAEENILPLLVDLTNPSSQIGWANSERMSLEERGPASIVMALALVHHLAISNNVPLEMIAEYFSKLSEKLIIEFVPKSDSQVEKLLSTREDVFSAYTKEGFEKAFTQYFSIFDSSDITDSKRTLYLMEKKENHE